jgi:hypothetical protein
LGVPIEIVLVNGDRHLLEGVSDEAREIERFRNGYGTYGGAWFRVSDGEGEVWVNREHVVQIGTVPPQPQLSPERTPRRGRSSVSDPG